MVKVHLPPMYMLLLIVSKEKIISIYSTISPNFSILLGSYVTFSSPSRRIVWVRSNFFKDTICFFVALTAKHPESSATFRQSDIIINFLTILVPLPIMAVELNQNYLEIPKEAIWYVLRFQIHCQCIRRLDVWNDELFE